MPSPLADALIQAEDGQLRPGAPSLYDRIVEALHMTHQAIDPFPRTGSLSGDMAAAIPAAALALRPSGVRLTPTNTTNPRMQIRGRFSGHTNEAMLNHPGVGKWPFIASGQLASNTYGTDDAPVVERAPAPPLPRNDADLMANTEGAVDVGLSPTFDDRWGGMAAPSASRVEEPLFLRSGMQNAPSRLATTAALPPAVALALARATAPARPAPKKPPAPERERHSSDKFDYRSRYAHN